MNQELLDQALGALPIGEIRFLVEIGSTNDFATKWAFEGAENLSLVIADKQSAGRGRSGRRWITHPNSALAFSLILRPEGIASIQNILRVTALGAIAIVDVLMDEYGVAAEIKWPNDVLLSGRKVAGILSEGHWIGNRLITVILGIGINVAPKSVPPDEILDFPATCVEHEIGRSVDRIALLKAILQRILSQLPQIDSKEFLRTWEKRLAFMGQWVMVTSERHHSVEGQVVGLDSNGQLRLQLQNGQVQQVQYGDIHLRPVDRSTK